jgi:hypothetical protein
MIHTDLINYVIKKKGFKSYLEIGVHRPEHNHHLIDCQFKIGCDPNPDSRASFTGMSDEFFNLWVKTGYPPQFDIVFIDGLHWSEQVKRDFENCLSIMTDGIILIHDTDPKEERFSVYPRKEPRRWNGDVFKFIAQLPSYSGIDWRTPDVDANGLTVVKRSNRVAYDPPYKDLDYQTFKENRKEILQLCTRQEFEEWV